MLGRRVLVRRAIGQFTGDLYMNRTKAITSFTGQAWYGRLDLSVSGTALRVPVPDGPYYSITINITSPMFKLLSDAKTPDCQPFRNALIEAVAKAAKQAGREIAAQMSAEQKVAATRRQQQQREVAQQLKLSEREERLRRRAWSEAAKAERKKRPTIREVVLELLPGAVEKEAASGYRFNTRRLVYRIRDQVLRCSGKELEQSYFDKLLTEIEAKQGDLHPLLIREPRGAYSIPHFSGDAIPLGTESVRSFIRPTWVFNKVITIEKEDLRFMLRQAGWDRRHDAFLTSAKGFNTRAARDLIDAIAATTEPVRVFSVHDADSAGTLIQHTLQHKTLARAARKIEITDLGLQPWEGIGLGLAVEKVPPAYTKGGKQMRRPVGDYVYARTDRTPNGEKWEDWLQHSRIELNAFTSAELIAWLDRKMAEAGESKLIPPDDILQDQFSERVRERAHLAVVSAIGRRSDDQVAAIEVEQAEAVKPIQAELDVALARLRKRLAEIQEPFLRRIVEASEPFQQRIATVYAETAAIDREAEVQKAIEEITPEGEEVRTAITKAFTERPMLRWADVLHEIADAAEIGDIDDAAEEAQP
jgi:hypothetical protein